MTPKQAIEFASTLDRPDVWEKSGVLDRILSAIGKTASRKAKREALQTLLDGAEQFRNANAPGHDTWYHEHLRAAATAATVWGLTE